MLEIVGEQENVPSEQRDVSLKVRAVRQRP